MPSFTAFATFFDSRLGCLTILKMVPELTAMVVMEAAPLRLIAGAGKAEHASNAAVNAYQRGRNITLRISEKERPRREMIRNRRSKARGSWG